MSCWPGMGLGAGVGVLVRMGGNNAAFASKAACGDHPGSSRVLVIVIVGRFFLHGASVELNELSTFRVN